MKLDTSWCPPPLNPTLNGIFFLCGSHGGEGWGVGTTPPPPPPQCWEWDWNRWLKMRNARIESVRLDCYTSALNTVLEKSKAISCRWNYEVCRLTALHLLPLSFILFSRIVKDHLFSINWPFNTHKIMFCQKHHLIFPEKDNLVSIVIRIIV